MIPTYAGSGGRSGFTIAEGDYADDTDLDAGTATTYPLARERDWYDITDIFILRVPNDFYDTLEEYQGICGNWWDWYRWTPDYPPEKLRVRGYRAVLPVKRVIKQPCRIGFNRKGRLS